MSYPLNDKAMFGEGRWSRTTSTRFWRPACYRYTLPTEFVGHCTWWPHALHIVASTRLIMLVYKKTTNLLLMLTLSLYIISCRILTLVLGSTSLYRTL